jgi:hypothetical protein
MALDAFQLRFAQWHIRPRKKFAGYVIQLYYFDTATALNMDNITPRAALAII